MENDAAVGVRCAHPPDSRCRLGERIGNDPLYRALAKLEDLVANGMDETGSHGENPPDWYVQHSERRAVEERPDDA